MTLEKRRLKFLNETVQFYTEDTSRRALSNDEYCMYCTEDGKKCAIGRHIPANKYQSNFEQKSVHVNDELQKVLPKRILNLGIDFLRIVQRLHDNGCNWNTKGLSDKGKKYIEEIKKDYCDSLGLVDSVETVYKIRYKPTGEFLLRNGYTDKTGRIFSNIGHAKLSLNTKRTKELWEIVPFSIKEIE